MNEKFPEDAVRSIATSALEHSNLEAMSALTRQWMKTPTLEIAARAWFSTSQVMRVSRLNRIVQRGEHEVSAGEVFVECWNALYAEPAEPNEGRLIESDADRYKCRLLLPDEQPQLWDSEQLDLAAMASIFGKGLLHILDRCPEYAEALAQDMQIDIGEDLLRETRDQLTICLEQMIDVIKPEAVGDTLQAALSMRSEATDLQEDIVALSETCDLLLRDLPPRVILQMFTHRSRDGLESAMPGYLIQEALGLRGADSIEHARMKYLDPTQINLLANFASIRAHCRIRLCTMNDIDIWGEEIVNRHVA